MTPKPLIITDNPGSSSRSNITAPHGFVVCLFFFRLGGSQAKISSELTGRSGDNSFEAFSSLAKMMAKMMFFLRLLEVEN